MLEWFSAALASANAAKDLTQSIVTLRDEDLIRSRVFDLTNKLMDLQGSLMQAQLEQMGQLEKIKALEAQLAKADESARYERHQFSSGCFAYQLKPAHRDEGAIFYICSHCHEQHGKQITLHEYTDSEISNLSCPGCKSTIRMRPDAPYQEAPNPYVF